MFRQPSTPEEARQLGMPQQPFGIAPITDTLSTVPPLAQPAGAFTWGAGGAMITPDQLARRQAIAQGMMKSDFSPVQSVWQGVGRVAENLIGAMQERKLDKQAVAAQDYNARIAASLFPTDGKPDARTAAAVLSNPYASEGNQAVAKTVLDRAMPKQTEPHYFEDNAGNQWAVGPNGVPQRVFTDPTPKMYIQGDQAFQIHNPYSAGSNPMGATAAPAATPAAAPQVGLVEDGYRFMGGDPADPKSWASVAGGPTQPRRVRFRGDRSSFGRAVVAQESGGRYGIANAEGSGARGVGQVMPATAQALAARLGLPWRPDLMAGSHSEAQAYQNAITEAALDEAWAAGKGNPAAAAMYYHGGSNHSTWGPKTHRYAGEVIARMGAR